MTLRTETRIKGTRWCRLEVSLSPEGRLSICGAKGRIVTGRTARADAREYWRSFFEENPGELLAMNERCGTAFRSAERAARYVLDTDGDFHGMDVDRVTADGKKVFITEGCGQIVEALERWFPEVKPYLKWHLNDMHAECEHQEARGETYTTHPLAVCPDCSYRLGSAWTKRALPLDVVAWAESIGTTPAPKARRTSGHARLNELSDEQLKASAPRGKS